MCIYIYIYMYTHFYTYTKRCPGGAQHAADLRTKLLDFKGGFDSSVVLIFSGLELSCP